MLSDGYHFLPAGRIAVFTTFLRHSLRQRPCPAPLPAGYRLERLTGADGARYRALFRAVGQEWLWFGRLRLTEAELHALLDHPALEAHALVDEAGDCGLLELDFRLEEPELVYFGLLQRLIGQGLGRRLAEIAFVKAKARGAASLMVHTCSFDAPGALGFYRRMGFEPYAHALECFTDPRIDGTLPQEAAVHVPFIGN